MVNTVVGRPRHVKSVYGFRRYTAATETGFQPRLPRGEAYKLETAAAPEDAIACKQSAERMSRMVYRRMLIRRPRVWVGDGSRENSGSSKDA